MRVGIIDSGVGGLTILKELLESNYNNEYIYYGDTINIPYGEKSKNELILYTDKIIKFLAMQDVDCIILACGTLSCTIYDKIKDLYGLPIYDIITPVINNLKKSDYNNVLLLGTEKTIQTKVFRKKLEDIGLNVYEKSCSNFVPIIENKIKGNIDYYIAEYLYDFKDRNIDLIIPGCTHYSLISDKISAYMAAPCLDVSSCLVKSLDLKYSVHSLKLYFSKVDDNLKNNVLNIIGDYEIIEKKL